MKKKKSEKKAAPRKRKNRSKFRPTFKSRAVYSFANCLNAIEAIRDGNESEGDSFGMMFISAYRNLSHSIEMLCKSTLDQRSPFLLHKNLNKLDDLYPKVSLQEETCGAWVALARASKLFKTKFSNEDSVKLERVLFARNRCEHNEFYISNFANEMHTIASAAEVIVRVYNDQFRQADLLKEVDVFSSKNAVQAFYSALRENSNDFKKTEAKIQRLESKGAVFTTCWSCHYEFAQLDETASKYKCLWCNDERVLKTCSISGCASQFWDVLDSSRTECNRMHLGSPMTMSQLASGHAMMGSTAMTSGSAIISMKSGSPISDSVWLTTMPYDAISNYNPWVNMGSLANPPGEEPNDDDTDKPDSDTQDDSKD
jgi:hypothetical protein